MADYLSTEASSSITGGFNNSGGFDGRGGSLV